MLKNIIRAKEWIKATLNAWTKPTKQAVHEDQLEKIRKIDPKAAEYIEEIVLPRWVDVDHLTSKELLDHFIWSQTLQGQDYWFKIWRALNGIT